MADLITVRVLRHYSVQWWMLKIDGAGFSLTDEILKKWLRAWSHDGLLEPSDEYDPEDWEGGEHWSMYFKKAKPECEVVLGPACFNVRFDKFGWEKIWNTLKPECLQLEQFCKELGIPVRRAD